MTEPPHVSQRSWCQSGTTTAGIAGRKRLPTQLGQAEDSSTPTSRAHNKQPSSTLKRMVRRGDGRRWPAAISAVAFVALGADARESSSGVNVNPPLCYFSGGVFVMTKEVSLTLSPARLGGTQKAP